MLVDEIRRESKRDCCGLDDAHIPLKDVMHALEDIETDLSPLLRCKLRVALRIIEKQFVAADLNVEWRQVIGNTEQFLSSLDP